MKHACEQIVSRRVVHVFGDGLLLETGCVHGWQRSEFVTETTTRVRPAAPAERPAPVVVTVPAAKPVPTREDRTCRQCGGVIVSGVYCDRVCRDAHMRGRGLPGQYRPDHGARVSAGMAASRKRTGRPPLPLDTAEARRLLESGASLRGIGRALGVSSRRIERAFTREASASKA